MTQNIAHGFVRSAELRPNACALYVQDRSYSYRELLLLARQYASAIVHETGDSQPLVAILAARSETAYGGILGTLLAGKGYVPLNPKFPVERLVRMLELSLCRTLIVGSECIDLIEPVLALLEASITVILSEEEDLSGLKQACPQHEFIVKCPFTDDVFVEVSADDLAYLLFTSGSTGDPKGVAVSHRAVRSYVSYIADRYGVQSNDRFSQHFDLTFDLSAHDMFVCWEQGASLYVIPEKFLIMPAKFIREHELTMWFSVPSAIGFMRRTGVLKPGVFPSLRWSLFCGEPLPAESASAWQAAAPNSTVENLYGPTEATIAITHYRWQGEPSHRESVNGVVPIGVAFAGQKAAVINAQGALAECLEQGELVLGGSQLADGYWQDSAKTAERFVQLPQLDGDRWYRTSDLVYRNQEGCLFFIGRTDDQVKIRGYRVELQEIEHTIRQVSSRIEVACIAWPVQAGSAEGIVAFVCSEEANDGLKESILEHSRQKLPEYMVPRKLLFIERFPQNANGKVDRKQLAQGLEGQE